MEKITIDFIEWLGENYIKMHGGWHPRYSNQHKPDLKSTEQMFEAYNALKDILKNEAVKVTPSPVEGEKEERIEGLNGAADRYVSMHEDSAVTSMYGHHYRTFLAGANWQEKRTASRIKALEERLEKVTKIINHELAEIPKLQDFASKHGDAQGYARICGQEIILETLKQKFDKLKH